MQGDETAEAGGTPPASHPPGHRGPPQYTLTLWPNRSLPRRGFRWVLAFTAVMLTIPLIPLLGTPVGLALIPFLLATLGALWFFIERNYRDGAGLSEDVALWPDLMRVTRRDPGGRVRTWEANPYWVRIDLEKDARPENYITLKGGPREIELGAFLSPEERLSLRDDLDRALGHARASARS